MYVYLYSLAFGSFEGIGSNIDNEALVYCHSQMRTATVRKAGLRILFTNIWAMQFLEALCTICRIVITGTLELLMFASPCFPQACKHVRGGPVWSEVPATYTLSGTE